MDVVEADTPLEDVVKTIVSRGHSRFPVYDDTIDRILGIVHSRDVLESLASALLWGQFEESGPASLPDT